MNDVVRMIHRVDPDQFATLMGKTGPHDQNDYLEGLRWKLLVAYIAPLIDRFDVMVESKHPGANLAAHIGLNGPNGQVLRHEGLEGEFQHVLGNRLPYPERTERIEALCDRFGDALTEGPGIQSLSQQDRAAIRSEQGCIPFDVDFNAFLRLVLSELSFCHHFGSCLVDPPGVVKNYYIRPQLTASTTRVIFGWRQTFLAGNRNG